MKKSLSFKITRMACMLAFLTQGLACSQTKGSGLDRVKQALMLPGSEKTEAKTGSFPPYNGPRHTLAVGEFKADTPGSHSLRNPLRTTLEAALLQSNYFDVLDRSDFDPADGEREMNEFDAIQRGTYKVFGHITAIEDNSKQAIKIPIPFGNSGNKIALGGNQATIRLTAKIVHVKTGRTVAHRDIEAQSNASRLSIDMGAYGRNGGFDNETRTPVEIAAINAVYELTKFVCETMGSVPVPGSTTGAKVRVLKMSGHELVIDAGQNQGVHVGDEFGLLDEFGFPESGFRARVTMIQPDHAKCVIVEGERPAEVGNTLTSL